MNIIDFMKMFSSEVKLKLLIHFYTCNCNDNCVNDLVEKFGTTQANISKHLIQMSKAGVLTYSINHRIRIYKIDQNFIKIWKELLQEIAKHNNIKKYSCHCQN